MQIKNHDWIHKPSFDLFAIIGPSFIGLFLVIVLPVSFWDQQQDNPWIWLLLVMGIDAGHVYATVYRTYLDKQVLAQNKFLLVLAPCLFFIVSVFVHLYSPRLFWTCMAYLAVFHFVRQQYGFMRLYKRKEQNKLYRTIDALAIYSATIYPLVYWHLSGPLSFNWFVDGDFFYFNSPAFIPIFFVLYIIILLIYLLKEIKLFHVAKQFNLPANLLLLGTIFSWYAGIVYMKSDLSFTLLNVVAHGVPYYAVVWATGRKRALKEQNDAFVLWIFRKKRVVVFLALLFSLAYTEEWLWDVWVWREHGLLFPFAENIRTIILSNEVLCLLVPLFSLPQLMHYFIDGFIWKIRNEKFGIGKLLQ